MRALVGGGRENGGAHLHVHFGTLPPDARPTRCPVLPTRCPVLTARMRVPGPSHAHRDDGRAARAWPGMLPAERESASERASERERARECVCCVSEFVRCPVLA
eukprot:1423784-Rhodomonas_salina.1